MQKCFCSLLDVLLGLKGSRQIASHELNGRQVASVHGLLHLVNGSFLQLETMAVSHGKQASRVGIGLQRDQVRRILKVDIDGLRDAGAECRDGQQRITTHGE